MEPATDTLCGFAGAQYPATALVAENRTIGPASTQSVPSNGDNQDVVSMGLIAARNARRVLSNNDRILTFSGNWYPNRWIKVQMTVFKEEFADPSIVTKALRTTPSFWSRVLRIQFSI